MDNDTDEETERSREKEEGEETDKEEMMSLEWVILVSNSLNESPCVLLLAQSANTGTSGTVLLVIWPNSPILDNIFIDGRVPLTLYNFKASHS